MIAYFPHRKWFNRLAGLTVCVGLVWYYIAPVGSTVFTLVAATLFIFTVALGAAMRRLDRRRERRNPDGGPANHPVP